MASSRYVYDKLMANEPAFKALTEQERQTAADDIANQKTTQEESPESVQGGLSSIQRNQSLPSLSESISLPELSQPQQPQQQQVQPDNETNSIFMNGQKTVFGGDETAVKNVIDYDDTIDFVDKFNPLKEKGIAPEKAAVSAFAYGAIKNKIQNVSLKKLLQTGRETFKQRLKTLVPTATDNVVDNMTNNAFRRVAKGDVTLNDFLVEAGQTNSVNAPTMESVQVDASQDPSASTAREGKDIAEFIYKNVKADESDRKFASKNYYEYLMFQDENNLINENEKVKLDYINTKMDMSLDIADDNEYEISKKSLMNDIFNIIPEKSMQSFEYPGDVRESKAKTVPTDVEVKDEIPTVVDEDDFFEVPYSDYRLKDLAQNVKTAPAAIGTGMTGGMSMPGTALRFIGDVTGQETLTNLGKTAIDYWTKSANEMRPKFKKGSNSETVAMALENLGMMAPAMAMGGGLSGAGAPFAATVAGALYGGAQEASSTYNDFIDNEKWSPWSAAGMGLLQGGIETAFEYFPMKKLFGKSTAPILEKLEKYLVSELISEGLTTVAQGFSDTIAKTKDDESYEENLSKWAKTLPEQAKQVLFSTLIMAAAGGPIGVTSQKLAKMISQPKGKIDINTIKNPVTGEKLTDNITPEQKAQLDELQQIEADRGVTVDLNEQTKPEVIAEDINVKEKPLVETVKDKVEPKKKEIIKPNEKQIKIINILKKTTSLFKQNFLSSTPEAIKKHIDSLKDSLMVGEELNIKNVGVNTDKLKTFMSNHIKKIIKKTGVSDGDINIIYKRLTDEINKAGNELVPIKNLLDNVIKKASNEIRTGTVQENINREASLSLKQNKKKLKYYQGEIDANLNRTKEYKKEIKEYKKRKENYKGQWDSSIKLRERFIKENKNRLVEYKEKIETFNKKIKELNIETGKIIGKTNFDIESKKEVEPVQETAISRAMKLAKEKKANKKPLVEAVKTKVEAKKQKTIITPQKQEVQPEAKIEPVKVKPTLKETVKQKVAVKKADKYTFDIPKDKFSIYKVNTPKGVKYAVKLPKELSQSFSDPFYDTIEIAEKEQTFEIEKEKRNIAFNKKQEIIKTEETIKKKEQENVDGFDKDMPKMRRGQVIKALNKMFNFDGKLMTKKEKVRELVNDNAKISVEEVDKIQPMTRLASNRANQREQDAHEQRIKDSGKKKIYYVGGYDLGKTAYDYANHLMENKTKPTVKESLTVEKKPYEYKKGELDKRSRAMSVNASTKSLDKFSFEELEDLALFMEGQQRRVLSGNRSIGESSKDSAIYGKQIDTIKTAIEFKKNLEERRKKKTDIEQTYKNASQKAKDVGLNPYYFDKPKDTKNAVDVRPATSNTGLNGKTILNFEKATEILNEAIKNKTSEKKTSVGDMSEKNVTSKGNLIAGEYYGKNFPESFISKLKELLSGVLPKTPKKKEDKIIIPGLAKVIDIDVTPIKKKIKKSNNPIEEIIIPFADKTREKIQYSGVFFDKKNQRIQATNGGIFITVEADVKEGGIFEIDKNNKKLTGKKLNAEFPYASEIIDNSSNQKYKQMKTDDLLDKARGMSAVEKLLQNKDDVLAKIKQGDLELRINPNNLQKALETFKKLGIDEIEVSIKEAYEPMRIRDANNKKNIAFIMPIRNSFAKVTTSFDLNNPTGKQDTKLQAVDKEIENAWKEVKRAQGKILGGLVPMNAPLVKASAKLIKAYFKKGIYKLQDITKNVLSRVTADKRNDYIKGLKQAMNQLIDDPNTDTSKVGMTKDEVNAYDPDKVVEPVKTDTKEIKKSEEPELTSVYDTIEQSEKLSKIKRKITKTKIIKFLKRNIIDESANIKDFLYSLGDAGKKVVMHHDLIAGASAKAVKKINEFTESIFGDMNKTEKKHFDAYIFAKRSLEILKRKPDFTFQNNTKVQEFQKTINNIPADIKSKIEDKAKKYWSAFDEQLSELEKNGLITKESLKALRETGEYYSPRQVLDYVDPDMTFFDGSKKITVPNSGIQKLTDEGSLRLIETDTSILLPSVIARTQARIFKNIANQEMYNLAESNPENGLVQIAEKNEKLQPGFEKISVMIEGQKQEMILPSDLAIEWIKSDPIFSMMQTQILQIFSGTKILKMMATGVNPEFIITNTPRDIAHILLTTDAFSSTLPIAGAQIAKRMSEVFTDAVSRKGRYNDYIDEGGGMDFLSNQGRLFENTVNKKIEKVQGILSYSGETSEILTRLALREQELINIAKKKGVKVSELSLEDRKEATWKARNYLDFSQGGRMTKAASNIIPYLNAGIQGSRGIFRASKDRPAQTMYKAAQLGVASTLLYMFNVGSDEDEYDKISPTDKRNYFNILIPNSEYIDKEGNTRKRYVKIAKDQGQRVISSIFENLTAMSLGKEVDPEQIVKTIQDFLPYMPAQGIPPTLDAIIAYSANIDIWRGQPIWKGKKVKPELEQTSYTHPFFKKAGETLGMSPDRLKVALEQIFTSGNIYTSLGDYAYTKLFEEERKNKDVIQDRILKIPFIRKFLKKTDSYYKYQKKIDEAKIKANSKAYENTLKLDNMVQDYFDDKKTKEEIETFIKNQETPLESKRLSKRFSDSEKLKDIPDRRWWMQIKRLTPEERANQFWLRYEQSTEDEKKQLREVLDKLPGIKTKRFLDTLKTKNIRDANFKQSLKKTGRIRTTRRRVKRR